MPHYWVMAPVESKPTELFDKVWQFDLTHNVISIGWEQLGDVTGLTRDEMAEAVVADAPHDAHPQSQLGRLAGEDGAGTSHLDRIVADQLLSLAKALHGGTAHHDEVDAQVTEGDHIVLSLARVAGHQVPALRTRPGTA